MGVHLEDVRLKVLLLFYQCALLVPQLTIAVDLKLVWFDTTNYFVFSATYTKLDFSKTIFLIDTIDQHGFVDLTEWFSKQRKGKSIQDGTLTCAVATDD